MISKHVLNEPELFFFLHTVKWFHLFLSNMNNSISIKSFVCTVEYFQVLLCITKNSIKHQYFVYTQLNVRTVLFQTIQLSINT